MDISKNGLALATVVDVVVLRQLFTLAPKELLTEMPPTFQATPDPIEKDELSLT
jgi:hypothetical protein